MRVFVPDMTDFFSWLDKSGYRYVVLRGFLDFDKGYPPHSGKGDVDLLVEDAAQQPIRTRYGRYKKRQGVRCDVYNVNGGDDGGVRGCSYFPPPLAEYALMDRRLWKDKFYVPGARAHLLTLLYHIAYQKAEESKIDISDPEKSVGSKYCGEIEMLKKELSLGLPLTLMDFHRLLQRSGYAISRDAIIHYVQHDFKNAYKSLFHATVCAEEMGDVNLFVIRHVAVRKNVHEHLIRALRSHYKVVAVKDIPWFTRVTKSRKMRGGKWNRGGRPTIALVVFDPDPIPVTEEDRRNHSFVLNRRQFLKAELRDWYNRVTNGRKPFSSPIHSTDNAAEAIGHLPLFFSKHEQEDIFLRLAQLRREFPARQSS